MTEKHDSAALYEDCKRDGSQQQHDAFTFVWQYIYRIAYGMLYERPDGDALAADCAQKALIKVHRNIDRCEQPAAFLAWCGQIVRRTVLDELRRPHQRLRVTLPDDDHASWTADTNLLNEIDDLRDVLAEVIQNGPLSERSRRVVIGRYFTEQPDEELAATESELSGKTVLPAHIQVTRAKNLAALRRDDALLDRLRDFLE